jgi:hypothetical protein
MAQSQSLLPSWGNHSFMSERPSFGSSYRSSKSSKSYSSCGPFYTWASSSMTSSGTAAGAGDATTFPSSSSSSSMSFSPKWLSPYSSAISMISSSQNEIIPSKVVFSSLNLLHKASSYVIFWLDSSSCSPSRLTSLMASSRS